MLWVATSSVVFFPTSRGGMWTSLTSACPKVGTAEPQIAASARSEIKRRGSVAILSSDSRSWVPGSNRAQVPHQVPS